MPGAASRVCVLMHGMEGCQGNNPCFPFPRRRCIWGGRACPVPERGGAAAPNPRGEHGAVQACAVPAPWAELGGAKGCRGTRSPLLSAQSSLQQGPSQPPSG